MLSLNFIIALLITAVESYLLGSCNSAIIVCKLWKKTDIRTVGSKNAGLTNTFRIFGKGPAALTLIGDLSKGVIAVLIGKLIFHLLHVGIGPTLDTTFVGYVAGIFAIIGHIFPIYYGFKGGKGVLVAASILLVVDPLTFAIIIPFFALMVILTRYVSVSSITAAVVYPILTGVSQTIRNHLEPGAFPCVWLNVVLTVVTGILLIYMHRANIARLKNGTENKFGIKKKQE